MKILTLVCAAVLVLLPVGGVLCDAIDYIYDMSLVEADQAVSGWLETNDFQSDRSSTTSGIIIWTADKGRRQLHIVARRSSPLAVRIRIEAIEGTALSLANRLQMYLTGYFQSPTGSPAVTPLSSPQVVRGYLDAVVCLYASANGRQVQLTGFAVDLAGVVVCTGHDLEMGQRVDLVLHDGREIEGRVVKLDRQRDLALVRTSHVFDTVVSLRNGRFMINDGDALFAIACSTGGMAGIKSGLLDGPSRRVAGMPLWQVRMTIAAGSSGSPVFDGRGRLAAIVKGRFRGSEYIGFLIPFETLLHFLERY